MSSSGTRWLLPAVMGILTFGILALLIASYLQLSGSPRHPALSPALANPDVDGGTPTAMVPAPDFVLQDQHGRMTSLAGFRGKVVVLAFVDSQCTTICPLTTESMVEAARLLGTNADQVQLIGINANPSARRVADVAAYTRAHGMEGRWRFLTGPLPDLKRVWRLYHVYVAAVHNDIDHEPIFYLIDGRGRERRVYFTEMSYEGIAQQAQLLAQGIARLLPGHPLIGNNVPPAQIPPLTPDAPAQRTAVGDRSRVVTLGKGHPHLLLFFAGWLGDGRNLGLKLAALDDYAAAARTNGWPPPVAIDELSTEASAASTPTALSNLATNLQTPMIEDADGRLADGAKVKDLPWFVLVSRAGRIVWSHDGWLPANRLCRGAGRALLRPP
ncbi:MAG: SCO family protein [Verrucomicrobia bacterium]|nr:SCO family protein [Verrucomicrobiota bacterium]MDE3097896.1 SCO family protein [Verrucomicrobiota bacterium]